MSNPPLNNQGTSRPAFLLAASVIVLVFPPFLFGQETSRASMGSGGLEANNSSGSPSVSRDARFVAFSSIASNLVIGDTNGGWDVFVHDTQSRVTTRVSVDSSGVEGNGWSFAPSISLDGRFVTFESDATNLISSDTNGFRDVFLHDLLTGQTSLVSKDNLGVQGNQYSDDPTISGDGNLIAYISWASNLVSGDTNGTTDVFVFDVSNGSTTRMSVDSSGIQSNSSSWNPTISQNGECIAFESIGDNLVAGDTNSAFDVFVHEILTGQTTRVSVNSSGVEGDDWSEFPSISGDGRYVAFLSKATNLVAINANVRQDVYVHDRLTGQTIDSSLDSSGAEANSDSWFPTISADGQLVAYMSYAWNLVHNDANGTSDIFIHQTQTGSTIRVSLDSSGSQSFGSSGDPTFSGDGGVIAFSSDSPLTPGDNNGSGDVFLHSVAPMGLSVAGDCPGTVTITTTGASPLGQIATVWGSSGHFGIPSGFPCGGTILNLIPLPSSTPSYQISQVNAAGVSMLVGNLPTAACGLLRFQAVDLSSCSVSNVVAL